MADMYETGSSRESFYFHFPCCKKCIVNPRCIEYHKTDKIVLNDEGTYDGFLTQYRLVVLRPCRYYIRSRYYYGSMLEKGMAYARFMGSF